MKSMDNDYSDIINLPHHESPTRARMARADRAVQFAPFAALCGYDAAIKETARVTDEKVEVQTDEARLAELNEKLRFLDENERSHPEITVKYFVADKKKSGGKYVSVTSLFKRLNKIEQTILLMNGTVISFEDIIEINDF